MSAESGGRVEGGNNNRPRPSFQIASRDSDAGNLARDLADTPYRTLRQLANIPKPTTPIRRASSAGPPSTHNFLRRTPATQIRTPRPAQRTGGSGRKSIAVTPHGRAARRELQARRAGLTPGKDRRKSGVQKRETPRDALRALSRLLAPKSLPVVPTPTDPSPPNGKPILLGQDDSDDGPELERPRLSLPLAEDDEDDDDDESLFLPPRSSGLEDENYTIQSVELARRAASEKPPGRLSRGSFGSIRLSDRFSDLDGYRGDGSSFIGNGFEGDGDATADVTEPPGDNSVTFGDLGFEGGMSSLAPGRNSDIRPTALPGDDNETTFVFTVPPRDVSEQRSEDIHNLPEPQVEDGDQYPYKMDEVDVEEAAFLETIRDIDPDPALQDRTIEDIDVGSAEQRGLTRKKRSKVSKHGIEYPSLPTGVVKKLATSYARIGGNNKAKISKEALDAIMQASDWFFEQASDDLGAYSNHAGRKTIDESDVVTLMGRQRQTQAGITPFSLAQKYLPRELLQDLRMPPPPKLKKGRRLEVVEEEE